MANSPFLTVVIPAYNEEKRMPGTLDTVTAYLGKQEYTSEVIVVDDGSADETCAVVRSFIARHQADQSPADQSPADRQEPGEAVVQIRLIANDHRGKGYTVRTGMLNGKGKYVLFTDADLATPIAEVGKMIGSLEAGADIAIGTREGIGASREDEPFLRHLMGRVFNLLVRVISGLQFQDTQCGFKGFRREVAQDLFGRVQLYGADAKQIKGGAVTGFDVEVLFLALQSGYRIDEIPVRWQYGAESKVNPVVDSLRMFKDVMQVRWNAMRGMYGGRAEARQAE
jgi:glycosyltransferase involved in cell wall biosynthesis